MWEFDHLIARLCTHPLRQLFHRQVNIKLQHLLNLYSHLPSDLNVFQELSLVCAFQVYQPQSSEIHPW